MSEHTTAPWHVWGPLCLWAVALALTIPSQAVTFRLYVLVFILVVLGLSAFAIAIKVQEMDAILRPTRGAETRPVREQPAAEPAS